MRKWFNVDSTTTSVAYVKLNFQAHVTHKLSVRDIMVIQGIL
jgi:hypothetical protein